MFNFFIVSWAQAGKISSLRAGEWTNGKSYADKIGAESAVPYV
jgi:hypothetical protein